MNRFIKFNDDPVLGDILVFRGSNIPVAVLIDYMENDKSIGQFIQDFPEISKNHCFALFSLLRILLDNIGEKERLHFSGYE